jgi:hypothetical protein
LFQLANGGNMDFMLRPLGMVLLAAVALGCSAGSAVGGSESRPAASLQVVKRVPLTLKGRSFRAGETVRVVAAGARTQRVRASQSGTFVVTLGGPDRCSTTRVLATGSGGSQAILKVLPSPACLPARTP